jgi:maltooligosyltrehalose synthase
MAYACVASTIEVLTQPCIIRVITQCEPMLLTMTGKIRLQDYYEQRIRMQKAIRDGGHKVEWSKPENDYEHRTMAIVYEAAMQVANLDDDENSLDVIADQTMIITSYIRDPKLVQKMILQQDKNSAQNLFGSFQANAGNLVTKMRRVFSSILLK